MSEQTIWKYDLGAEVAGRMQIEVPAGSQLRWIGFDPSGELVAWMQVDPSVQEKSTWRITCVGTGHPVPADAGEYVTTLVEGVFVWHFFIRELASVTVIPTVHAMLGQPGAVFCCSPDDAQGGECDD